MSGIIKDSKTQRPIEFANIGIQNRNVGTVSSLAGKFNLKISNKFLNDSLTISHINYWPVKIPVRNIINHTIFLEPRINELSEIIVTNKKNKEKRIGVKRHNPSWFLGAMSRDMDIMEHAQRIDIGDKTVRVKCVNIYIKKMTNSRRMFVRFNFYKIEENAPGKRIVFENTIQEIQIKQGWLHIDLTEYDIYINENFFVGVEFIPDFNNPFGFCIGGISTKKKGYCRKNSHGKWIQGIAAPSINVEIEY